MNALIKQLSADRTIFWGVVFSLVIIFICVFITLLFYYALPPVVPLFNQLPWGTSRLAAKIGLFFPPSIVFGFLLLNLVIIKYLYERIPVLARMLSITTLLTAVLALVFVFRIVHLIL